MIGPATSSGVDDERDVRAVAALVKLLADSGCQSSRIKAALTKPATAANSGRFSDAYAAAVPHKRGRRPQAA